MGNVEWIRLDSSTQDLATKQMQCRSYRYSTSGIGRAAVDRRYSKRSLGASNITVLVKKLKILRKILENNSNSTTTLEIIHLRTHVRVPAVHCCMTTILTANNTVYTEPADLQQLESAFLGKNVHQYSAPLEHHCLGIGQYDTSWATVNGHATHHTCLDAAIIL